MQHRTRRLVAAATLTLVVLGAGSAFAASSQAASRSGGHGVIGGAVAGYLGLTKQQLRDDLRSGETLAQIATTQGKSISGLEQAIAAAVKSRLDQAVAAGKLTSQREQTIIARLQSRLDTLVNSTHPRPLGRRALKGAF
jgi:hypothetical protein